MREVSQKDISQIQELLLRALNVQNAQVVERLGGMTNRTYHVETPMGELAVRLPGEGTEAMIDRHAEEKSTRLAVSLGIDEALLYFGEKGEKITRYIPQAHTMTAEELRQPEFLREAAAILHQLHTCGEDTGVPFAVFPMAECYEGIIRSHGVAFCGDYEKVKHEVERIHHQMQGAPLAPCHNDPLCANWVNGTGGLRLVDWEYAGMNDPLWDLADVSIEAEYREEQDENFLKAYFGRTPTGEERQRFTANKVFLDYLWTLWALTRVPFEGKSMENYAEERWQRLRCNLVKLQ